MLQSRITITSLLLPLLLIVSAGSHAQEATRWYDVEVLLFVQQSKHYRASEQWPADYTEPQLSESKRLLSASSSATKPVAFSRLGAGELQLRADAARIQSAPDLELLAHFGWRQPGLPQDKAIPIRLSEELLNSPARQGELPRLSGTLKLILSRYLHIETDLLYREPATTVQDEGMGSGQDLFQLAQQQDEAGRQQSLYRVYRLEQSRRMRSGELHYLDHPVFGMAIKVSPYKLR